MRYKLFNGYYCLKNTEKIKLFSSSHFVISFLSLLISYLRRYSTLRQTITLSSSLPHQFTGKKKIR